MVEEQINTPSTEKELSSDNITIDMDGNFDITSASEFKSTLENAVSSYSELILEAKNLEKITTPCVQLIICAAEAMHKKDGKLVLRNSSKEIEEVFSDLGFIVQFNEWKEND